MINKYWLKKINNIKKKNIKKKNIKKHKGIVKKLHRLLCFLWYNKKRCNYNNIKNIIKEDFYV